MTEPKTVPASPTPPASPDARPAYEPPRVTRKKAVHRATLFTGGANPGNPGDPSNLVGGG